MSFDADNAKASWHPSAPLIQAEGEDEAMAPAYLLWADDGLVDGAGDKTGSGLTHIPASKPRLPGHEESYNPPAEYLPTEVRGAPPAA